MPKLDWIGKKYVVNHTDEVPFRLLGRVPEASTRSSATAGAGRTIVTTIGSNLDSDHAERCP